MSRVRYEGFLASTAFVVAPLLQFDSRRLSLAGQGSFTVFESGNEVIQGTAAAAWLLAARGSRRLELFGSGGASQYAAEPVTGYLLGGARAHLLGNTHGVWVSASAGRSFEGLRGTPVEAALAGWMLRRRLTLVGTLTAVLHSQVRQLDLAGVIRWNGRGGAIEARLGARPWASSAASGGGSDPFTGGYGELSASLALTRRLSLSASGGKYPPDPVRQTLGAHYLSAGFRFSTAAPRALPVSAAGVLRGRPLPATDAGAVGGGPRLELLGRSAEGRTLRVTAAGARSVEVMGDFTDWVAVPLRQVRGRDRWEVRLPLAGGVYRINLRIDGGVWSVPAGLRSERTEFGGSVGILVVP